MPNSHRPTRLNEQLSRRVAVDLDQFVSSSSDHGFGQAKNQATGYATQHDSVQPVPSHDNLGGLRQEGHPVIKMGGYGGRGAVSSDRVVSTRTVGASASIIFPCSTKSRRLSRWRAIIFLGMTPWAPPHAYVNRRWGNPAGTQHNPMLRRGD